MDKTKAMLEENTVKLLFTYSLPVIIGLFVGASYNIVDRILLVMGWVTLGWPALL